MSPIPTYLSHSYWPEDRAVNRYFWDRFWEAGFAFTVDPKAPEQLTIPHLELMMQRSACFVAVVPHRAQQERYRTSPYIVFEHNMAVRASKPVLVIAESNVAGRYFDGSPMAVFHRDDLGGADLDAKIEQLAILSKPHSGNSLHVLGSVGLVLPRGGVYARARRAIREVLESAGYRVDDLRYERDRAPWLPYADRHDFLVIDIRSREIPTWLHPMLHGRFVPMIRLAHQRSRNGRDAPFPGLLRDEAIEWAGGSAQWAIRWADVDDLAARLRPVVDKLQRPRRQFRSLEEGAGYFQSLGRSLQGSVFISNAAAQNDLARDLSRLLDLNNIAFFHYQHKNSIPMGTAWRDQLWECIRRSRLFVPLITDEYWRSPLCAEEFRLAEKLAAERSLTIYPCFLDGGSVTGSPASELQGVWLKGLSPEAQLGRILRSIDRYLTLGGNGHPFQPALR
jgi:TIR domain